MPDRRRRDLTSRTCVAQSQRAILDIRSSFSWKRRAKARAEVRPAARGHVNTVEYQQGLGRKVAQERRRHGLSQPELAAMVDRPVAWVSQLERGVQPIERMSVLKPLADALELPLEELARDAPAGVGSAGKSVAADALRKVLAGGRAVRGVRGGARAPPPGELRAWTEKACALA